MIQIAQSESRREIVTVCDSVANLSYQVFLCYYRSHEQSDVRPISNKTCCQVSEMESEVMINA